MPYYSQKYYFSKTQFMFHNTAEEQKLFHSFHLYIPSSHGATKPRRMTKSMLLPHKLSKKKKPIQPTKKTIKTQHLPALPPKPLGNPLKPLFCVSESLTFLS